MDIPKLYLRDRIFALCPNSKKKKKDNFEENAEKVLVAGSIVLI